MSNVALWTQANHTLTLIGQRNPSAEHIKVLHDGYLSDVVEAIVLGTVPARDEFRKILGLPPLELWITVNRGLSLKEMITAGEYDWVNPEITPERFPITGTGENKLKAEIIHFNCDMSSEDVVAKLDKVGLRPGSIEELLAFGATFPDMQRKFPIVALGSSARVDGRRRVAFLYGGDSGRGLNLDYWGDGWGGFYRFLAFRK